MFNAYDELEKRLLSIKRNRGWIEITNLILLECIRGSVKTRIMYRCNLNSKQIQQYLDFLVRFGLVDKRSDDPSHRVPQYYTTQLGMKFNEAYDQLRKVLKESNPGEFGCRNSA